MASEAALAREEKLFVATQSTQSQDFTNFVPGNQIYPISAFQCAQAMRTFPNEEKRNSRVRLNVVQDRFEVATWSVSTYVKDASTVAAEPEVSPLVRATIGSGTQASATVIHSSGTNTTTILTVTKNTYKNKAGCAILVKKGTSLGTYYEETWITTAASSPVATKARIVVSPALGTAPIAGVAVVGSWTYMQATTSPPALAFLSVRGHTSWRVLGGTGNQMMVKAPGEGPATMEFSGEAMKVIQTGTDALGASVATAGVTSFTIAGSAQRFEKGSFFVLSKASGTPSPEIVYVNGDVPTSATTTLGNLLRGRKGTTATAWTTAAAVTISPWYPGALATTATVSQGKPIAGYKGVVQLDGSNLVVRDIESTYMNNAVMNTGEKNNGLYVTSYSHPGFSDVTGKLTAYFRKEDARYFRDARHIRERELHIPIGDPTTGTKMVAIQNRQITFKTPALGTEDQIEASIDWEGHGAATSDNDAYRIAWIT